MYLSSSRPITLPILLAATVVILSIITCEVLSSPFSAIGSIIKRIWDAVCDLQERVWGRASPNQKCLANAQYASFPFGQSL